jgi:hypothetical protein
MELRKFDGGATRSSANGKIDWYGVYHPLVEKSFGEYMKKHTHTEDGGIREFNNWHSGWDKSISLQSLLRHVKDLEAIYSNYNVIKLRGNSGEETYYLKNGEVIDIPDNYVAEHITEEECVNAIRFNCGSYLLDILK